MHSLILLLVSLHAAYETVGGLPNSAQLPEPLGVEEPPHVLVLNTSPDGFEHPNLTTKQKNVLYHPEVQKMLVGQLQKDMEAFESDREDRDVSPQSLPPGFISPSVLSRWGIDWEDLGKEEEEDEEGYDFENHIQALLKANRYGGKQVNGVSDGNIWSQAYWHPSTILGTLEDLDEE